MTRGIDKQTLKWLVKDLNFTKEEKKQIKIILSIKNTSIKDKIDLLTYLMTIKKLDIVAKLN
jgi:hypothetical protein